MINNFMCTKCTKEPVCKILTIIEKFDEDAKKPLGVDITIDSCLHFEADEFEEDN